MCHVPRPMFPVTMFFLFLSLFFLRISIPKSKKHRTNQIASKRGMVYRGRCAAHVRTYVRTCGPVGTYAQRNHKTSRNNCSTNEINHVPMPIARKRCDGMISHHITPLGYIGQTRETTVSEKIPTRSAKPILSLTAVAERRN